MLEYCHDNYKTKQTCDEDCLATLKVTPGSFVTSKVIKELFTALYADENILYFKEDFSGVIFCCNGNGYS